MLSRALVCLLPLTPATHHVLNASALAALKSGYLINVARGGHLDQMRYWLRWRTGILPAQRLTFFEDEPIPFAHPIWRHPKVRVTPHISAATLRHEAIEQIVAKLRLVQRGDAVTGVLTGDRGY
jgi:glyoxylate/hydroxypyruvate reductase A